MSPFDDRFEELCTGWALGALDEHEIAELRWLLETATPEMLREWRELEAAALHLSVAPETVEPPSGVRTELLAAVRAEQRNDRGGWSSRLARILGLDRPRLALGVLATLLVLSIGLGVHVLRLQESLDTERQRVIDISDSFAEQIRLFRVLDSKAVDLVVLEPVEDDLSGFGKIIWNSESRVGLLQVTGLEPLSSEYVYQFWVYPTDGDPASAGFFTVDELYGGAYLRFEGFPAGPRQAVRGFVITREPAGGASEPSQNRYLGALVSP